MKKILISAAIAVAAVFIYNNFIAPKIGTPTA
jgi:hypothetical protein